VSYYTFTINVEREDPLKLRDQLINYDGKRAIFDLDKLICLNQVKMALKHADTAFAQSVNIAKVWGIEVALHLAATHQIQTALDLLGISSSTKRIGVIQEVPTIELKQVSEGLKIKDPDIELLERYGISQNSACLDIISKGVELVVDHE